MLTLVDILWIKEETRNLREMMKNPNQGPSIALIYLLFVILPSSLCT